MTQSTITYLALWKFYTEALTQKAGTKAPAQLKVIKNYLGLIFEHTGKEWTSDVGAELLSADEFAKFLEKMKKRFSTTSLDSIKSKLGKVRDHYLALTLKQNLADGSFGACIEFLVMNAGKSISEVAKDVGMPVITLDNWILEKQQPDAFAVGRIAKLEHYFSLPPGTLRNKLGAVLFGEKTKKISDREDLSSSEHMRRLMKATYAFKYKNWPEPLKQELQDMYHFYTDPILSGVNTGLLRHAERNWGIKHGKCSSFIRTRRMYESFFGFLTQPIDAQDPICRGLGISPEELSLVLITSPTILQEYMRFCARRQEGAVTTGFESVLKNIRGYLSTPFGYLLQRSDLGIKYRDLNERGQLTIPENMPDQSAPKDQWTDYWLNLCKRNHGSATTLRYGTHFTSGRDTFEPIRKVIDSRDIVGEIGKIIAKARDHAEQHGLDGWEKARRYRDFILILFHFLFEFRRAHYGHLEIGRHLIKRDGRWAMKAHDNDFKTCKHRSGSEFILEIPDDVNRYISTYVEKYRPLLMFPDSPYFFLASKNCNGDKRAERNLADNSISRIFRNCMVLFSESPTGFGSHSVRKIVSTAFGTLKVRQREAYRGAAGLAGHSVGVNENYYSAMNPMQEAYYQMIFYYQMAGVLEKPKELEDQITLKRRTKN